MVSKHYVAKRHVYVIKGNKIVCFGFVNGLEREKKLLEWQIKPRHNPNDVL